MIAYNDDPGKPPPVSWVDVFPELRDDPPAGHPSLRPAGFMTKRPDDQFRALAERISEIEDAILALEARRASHVIA